MREERQRERGRRESHLCERDAALALALELERARLDHVLVDLAQLPGGEVERK